jgi:adenylate cyclase
MAKEIERKFLINVEQWGYKGDPIKMAQAYLTIDQQKIIRVRIAGSKAYLTLKANVKGISRDEFEYEIPVGDAQKLLLLSQYPVVEKARYEYLFEGKLWEIDVFEGENKGLVVAEIELESEDEPFAKPDWLINEVSTDEKYYNFNLSVTPYSTWG